MQRWVFHLIQEWELNFSLCEEVLICLKAVSRKWCWYCISRKEVSYNIAFKRAHQNWWQLWSCSQMSSFNCQQESQQHLPGNYGKSFTPYNPLSIHVYVRFIIPLQFNFHAAWQKMLGNAQIIWTHWLSFGKFSWSLCYCIPNFAYLLQEPSTTTKWNYKKSNFPFVHHTVKHAQVSMIH